jgi:bifunctional non-homologous end joining protein LigD
VFIDYNQNAKDRTVASAFSVRPRPDARVSTPLTWDEIDACNPADFTLKTMPAWFEVNGDRHANIDQHPGSLEALMELSAKQEKEGLGDAPWPPQYQKMPGEPTRVQPSRARKAGPRPKSSTPAKATADKQAPSPTGRRVSKHPLIEVARSTKKDEALAQLETWKQEHAKVAALLEPADVLVDSMRGRSSTWTRVRINLQHVPDDQRPKAPTLPPIPNPWAKRRTNNE